MKITNPKSSRYDNYKEIFDNFKTHKNKTSLALFCAKDVQHFYSDGRVTEFIDFIEKYLKREKGAKRIVNIISNLIPNFYDGMIDDFTEVNYAVWSAIWAGAIIINNRLATFFTRDAITSAASAKAFYEHPKDESKRENLAEKYIQEYINVARNWERKWKNPTPLHQELSQDVGILLDKLEDDGDLYELVLPQKDETFKLNLVGFDITGKNEIEVKEKIIGSSMLTNTVTRLFV